MREQVKKREVKKIVIVDDDIDLLKMLTFAFEEKGYEVETFDEGKKALKALHRPQVLFSISLLILDRLLPDMDGIEIAKELKRQHEKDLPPMLFLSVLSSEKDVLSGLKTGAVDYIAKPFHLEILLEKARHLIE